MIASCSFPSSIPTSMPARRRHTTRGPLTLSTEPREDEADRRTNEGASMVHSTIGRWTALAGAVALTLSTAGCASDEATSPEVPPSTVAPSSTEAPATTVRPTTTDVALTSGPTTTPPTVPAEQTLINVYWGSTVVNPAAGSPERLGSGA